MKVQSKIKALTGRKQIFTKETHMIRSWLFSWKCVKQWAMWERLSTCIFSTNFSTVQRIKAWLQFRGSTVTQCTLQQTPVPGCQKAKSDSGHLWGLPDPQYCPILEVKITFRLGCRGIWFYRCLIYPTFLLGVFYKVDRDLEARL